MKNFYRFIVSLMLYVGVAVNVLAYDFSVDEFYFSILSEDEHTVTLTKGEVLYTGDIIIPESVEYNGKMYSVVALDNNCFHFCTELKSVVVPETVISLGNSAFAMCSQLESVVINSNITELPENLFYFCSMLKSFDIPETVTIIRNQAFIHCENLSEIVIPESVTSIGQHAFSWTGISEVNIPKNVTFIGDFCFAECKNLKNIEVDTQNSVYKSSAGILYKDNYFSNLVSFPAGRTGEYEIPWFVNTLSTAAFAGNHLSRVKFEGNNIDAIPDYCFSFSHRLKEIELTGNIKSLGNLSFSSSDSLASFTVPESVERIGERAFSNDDNLVSFRFNGTADLGDDIFAGSYNVKFLSVTNPVPGDFNSTAFNDKIYDNCILYVPEGAGEYFRNSPSWSKFKNIDDSGAEFVSLNFENNDLCDIEVAYNNNSDEDFHSVTGNLDYIVPEGNKVFVRVTPKEGYELDFVSYSVNGEEEVNFTDAMTFDISGNTVISVGVVKAKYTIEVAKCISNGSVELSVDGAPVNDLVEFGKTVSVTVKAAEGYEVESVSLTINNEEVIDITDDLSFAVNGNSVVSAVFKKIMLPVNFESEIKGGLVKVMNGKHEIHSGELVDYGSDLIVLPMPDTYYDIDAVSFGNKEVTPVNGLYFVTVESETDIDVTFKRQDVNSVSYDNNPAGGSFRVMKEIETDESVANGTVLYVNAVPEEGYEVESVSAGDAEVEFADGLYMFPVTDDTVIEVIFKAVEQSAVNSVKENKVYYDSWSKMLHVNGANLVKVYNVDGIEILNSRNGQDINVSGFAKGLYVADVDGVMVKFRV